VLEDLLVSLGSYNMGPRSSQGKDNFNLFLRFHQLRADLESEGWRVSEEQAMLLFTLHFLLEI
jgi:phosphatidylserine/phosphatidylglycerophosphate/cardiolipin synthase-like enzyme